ncbi:hypothetical protein GCM10009544_17700 [Streptomyces stramineus]|uniref:Uncharacterized protein n=1 Tax=Streptomyces stramineus TaxID=173861 RepID=A0ABP3JJ88_9ACTN
MLGGGLGGVGRGGGLVGELAVEFPVLAAVGDGDPQAAELHREGLDAVAGIEGEKITVEPVEQGRPAGPCGAGPGGDLPVLGGVGTLRESSMCSSWRRGMTAGRAARAGAWA